MPTASIYGRAPRLAPPLVPAAGAWHNGGQMQPRGADMSLAERVLAARKPAVVLRGPAACGKTTAAVAVYRHFLDPAGRPTALLVAPNAPAVRYLRRRLLADSPGQVAVAPGVLSFAALAARVLAAAARQPSAVRPGPQGDSPKSGEPAQPMSPFRRHLLLSRIVADLHESGGLAALGAVADTPGLVVALDRAIAELKRAAIEPEDLAKAVGDALDKRSDLVAVYTAYQRRLQDQGLFDTEGQMWLAREHLRSAAADGPLPGLEGVAAVIADGFTDFTPTQLEILALLARRLGRVVVTLPQADDGRQRMWHWTTPHAPSHPPGIRRGPGGDRRRARLARRRGAPGRPADLGLPVQPGRLPAAPAGPAGLAVIAASGVEAEVAAVARRVKKLLRDGAAAGSVAILARGLDAYAEPIRRIFAEHDIPVAEAPADLTDVPIVQFALDVASLAPELEWRAVLRVIRNSYFRPQALVDFRRRHGDRGRVAHPLSKPPSASEREPCGSLLKQQETT